MRCMGAMSADGHISLGAHHPLVALNASPKSTHRACMAW